MPGKGRNCYTIRHWDGPVISVVMTPPGSMTLDELVRTSGSVASTSGRLEKIAQLAGLLSRLEPAEVPIAIGLLTGWPRQGRLGVGWATVSATRPPAAATPSITLLDVDRAFDQIKAARGDRSAGQRQRLLVELLERSTAEEQQFLAMLIVGE